MLMLENTIRLSRRQAGFLALLGLMLGALITPADAQTAPAAKPKPATKTAPTTGTTQTKSAVQVEATTGTQRKVEVAPTGTATLIPLAQGPATNVEVSSATTIAVPTLDELAPTGNPSKPKTAEALPAAPPASVVPLVTPEAVAPPLPEKKLESAKDRAGVAEGKAPYLRETKTDIFDPSRDDSATPLQKAAKFLSERQGRRVRRSLDNIQNLMTYEYDLQGTDEKVMREEAMVRALQSAAGRVYFLNYYLLGRDLLEAYLRQNGKAFIANTAILGRHTLPGGRVAMKFRVSVNLDPLYKDLHAKHFIAEPNLRPIVAVHLQEIINGQRDRGAGSRARIERAMGTNLFRSNTDQMRKPALDQDLSGSPKLLKEARFEAQRNNVDVLITGTVAARPITQEKIYYDQYAYEDAEITLHMYRVDTGELVASVHDRYSSTAPTDAEAITKVLDALVTRATQSLAERLTGMWSKTMLDEPGRYRLMISGANPSDITSITNLLKTLSPGIEIYTKSFYSNVLVINVVTPEKITGDQIEAFLRGSAEPQLKVERLDKRHFSVVII